MITLRPFINSDKQALIKILNDPRVCEFLSTKIPNPYTERDAQWWIDDGSKTGYVRAITFKNRLVGCIGVSTDEFEYARNGEIGYWLDKESWGKGYATLAVKLVTDNIFNNSQINRIYAAVFSGNIGSMRVLEKCGYSPEAILHEAIYKNGKFYNNHIFTKLKNNKHGSTDDANANANANANGHGHGCGCDK